MNLKETAMSFFIFEKIISKKFFVNKFETLKDIVSKCFD